MDNIYGIDFTSVKHKFGKGILGLTLGIVTDALAKKVYEKVVVKIVERKLTK
jgi:hypothetical protein